MKIAGFDIGGANTDLAVIDFDGVITPKRRGEIRFQRWCCQWLEISHMDILLSVWLYTVQHPA